MLGIPKRPNSKGLEKVIDTVQTVGTFFLIASTVWLLIFLVLVVLGMFNSPSPSPWVWLLAWSPLFVGAPWVICFLAGWALMGVDLWRSGTFRRMKALRKQARNRH
jgi:uncharacterized integral membrane protein